jgi:hypothetical protein
MKSTGRATFRGLLVPLLLGALGLLECLAGLPADAQNAKTSAVPYVFQSLSPDRAAPGSSALTLTIYGTGFLAGTSSTSVMVPGSSGCKGVVATKVISSRQISATIPAVCLAKAATAWVSVKNGPSFSNVVFFPISNPTSIAFAPATQGPVTVPKEPVAVVTADFNNDGILDLAIASLTASNVPPTGGTVSVLLGNGDGTFQSPTSYTTGVPYGLAVGDFNGDGILDIATADESDAVGTSTTISLLLGKGDGTFNPATTIPSLGQHPFSIVAGDFNCDGKLDLVTANNLSNGQGVTLLLGKGDGTFQNPITFNECAPAADQSLCQNPTFAAAGDFDNDGLLDLAVLEWSQGTPQVALLRGSCSKGLTPNTVFSANLPPDLMQLAFGNFSGHADGTLDLAFIGNGTPAGNAGTLIGQGTLTGGRFTGFKPPTAGCASCTTAAFPNGLAVGDFNADGFLDVTVATGNFPVGSQSGTGVVTTLAGAGNGTFNLQSTTSNYSGSMSDGVVAGDFNNDGKLDLAVTNYSSNTVTILLHQ